MAREVCFDKILYGGDYNPEQWLDQPEILEQDIELMKEAHINTVTLGVFSWTTLEPREGEYHFEWLEKIINHLYENGIRTILATPSGARPKWMADQYKEVLRVDENRRHMIFGGRHNHCMTSPVYRQKTYAINTELAKRFGNHEAVLMWHISNELGGECHCELCQQAFRDWLKMEYKTIDAVNKAWNTTFWSHTYNDFSQIESPSPIGESFMHGLTLDWRRFVTYQTKDFVRNEIKALRDAGSDKPTTINMMYYFKGLDYAQFNDTIDVTSWDNYPTWHQDKESVTAMDTAMQHDFFRGLMKKPFLLMESCPSSTNWQTVSKLKKPGMLKASSYQALAHGSDSVLYFQIRQSLGASEKFHGAVIDHYGKSDTRVFQEVKALGEELEKLTEIIGTRTNAKAAIIYDFENIIAMEDSQGPRNENLYHKETALKMYGALRKNGIDVDVINQDQSLEEYKLVVIPMLYMFKEGFTDRARAFVQNGGKLVMTYWSGIVDRTDLCYLGGTPHGLMDVFGLRSEEIDGLYENEENECMPIKGNMLNIFSNYTCKHLCDIVRPDTAKVLMTYGKDFYAGRASLLENDFGEGEAYYVCADMEQAFYDELLDKIIDRAGIARILPKEEIQDGIEITTREKDDAIFVFIQNYSDYTKKIQIPDDWEALLFENEGMMTRFETRIYKVKKYI